MFHSLRLTSVIAALTISALFPSYTRAETDYYWLQSDFAVSSFLDVDPTGCIRTNSDLNVTEGRNRDEPGRTELSTLLNIHIYRYDHCKQQNHFEFYASTPIPADAFHVHDALQSASLQVTVDVEDRWIGIVPVTVNLTWTGYGEIRRGHGRDQYISQSTRYMSRSIGSYRSATTSGSITLGSMTLTGAGNGYGDLESGQRTVTIVNRTVLRPE